MPDCRARTSPTSRPGCGRSDRVVVAFSGGADSAFLAWVAHRTLGADGLPGRHGGVAVAGRRRAGRLPRRWPRSGDCGGWPSRPTSSTTRRYVRNDGDRCGRCKTALMDALGPAGRGRGATVVLGVNVDDLGDHRPGQRGGGRARRGLPARGRRLHEGRRAGAGRGGSVCGRGTSRRRRAWRRACPYGTPVTRGGAVARSSGPRRRCARLGFRDAARAPLRRHGPPGGAARRPRRAVSTGGTPSSPPSGPPATATSRSTSKGCARATSTRPWRHTR